MKNSLSLTYTFLCLSCLLDFNHEIAILNFDSPGGIPGLKLGPFVLPFVLSLKLLETYTQPKIYKVGENQVNNMSNLLNTSPCLLGIF